MGLVRRRVQCRHMSQRCRLPASRPPLVLLTTVRLCLAARRRSAVPDWRGGLAAADLAEDGAPDLDMTLRIMVDGVRQLDSRGTAHPRPSADGARLLRLFGALQHGDTGEAVEILQAWLPSKPLRWLLRYARNFVGVMAIQKLILPDRKVQLGTHFALRASASAFQD
jgi:hypothetical protein